jgi:nitrate/nitrite-specific signal transduction histidine kinase
MDIRKKLTLWFLLIVSFILIISSIAIYLFSSDYREDDFYNRLINKGKNTAKLLIEVDGVDAVLLRKIEKDNPVSLPNEKISIYNYKNQLLFSTDDEEFIKIDTNIFNRIRLEKEIRWTVDKHEVVGFLFTDTYDRFVVITGAVDIFGKKKLENLRLILLIVFLVSFVITFIFGWLFTLQFLRPIKLVVDQVNEIGVHNLNQRVDEGNEKDEIAHLAKTFNRMLDRLEAAFKLQKTLLLMPLMSLELL